MKGATLLGRKNYTQEGDAAVESFDALFFNNMTLVLHLNGRS
jgi:hypothetical protein